MLLQVLLAGADHLDGHELVAALLEAGDDVADEAALDVVSVAPSLAARFQPYLDAIGLDGDEAGKELAGGENGGVYYGTYVCSEAILRALGWN